MAGKRGIRSTAILAIAATALTGSLLAQSAQDRLAASVRDAGAQIQTTRVDLQNTIGALDELRNQKSGDLRAAYDKFSESTEKTRNSAGTAAKLYDTMSADSKTYFASWQSEIDAISNPDIKKASAKRLKTVQKQYDEVVKELKPIQPLFSPMMSDLDDLNKALGTDLTPAGIKALSKPMDKTKKALTKFQAPIVESMTEFDKMSASLAPAAQ
jgi:septal ring factor EnvC (AmiA/AmiB activator)